MIYLESFKFEGAYYSVLQIFYWKVQKVGVLWSEVTCIYTEWIESVFHNSLKVL